MAGHTCFYHNEEQWRVLAEQLRLTPCPHCKAVGTLIGHGFLYGFDDRKPQRTIQRARRIFCSNRNLRPGCGRTFSVWLADRIRRLSLTAHHLWQFLQRTVAGGLAAASHALDSPLSPRTWQRIWKRFDLGQSKIRTALAGLCPPPQATVMPSRRPPAAEVLAHLQAAFPNDPCPISTFQRTLRTFFL